jgi:hypothetical protein
MHSSEESRATEKTTRVFLRGMIGPGITHQRIPYTSLAKDSPECGED